MKAERRKSERREVLETFHVFLVIPKGGLHKIYLKDVSEGGLSFLAPVPEEFPEGRVFEAHFYINPTLRLPLRMRVAHVQGSGDSARVGCQFSETSSRAYKAYARFLGLLEDLRPFVDTFEDA